MSLFKIMRSSSLLSLFSGSFDLSLKTFWDVSSSLSEFEESDESEVLESESESDSSSSSTGSGDVLSFAFVNRIKTHLSPFLFL